MTKNFTSYNCQNLVALKYRRLRKRLVRLALQAGIDSWLAEDLVQEVFLRILLRGRVFDFERPLLGYATIAILREVRAHFSKNRPWELALIEAQVIQGLSDHRRDPYRTELTLGLFLEKFGPLDKDLALARYRDRLPVKRIAQAMSISERTCFRWLKKITGRIQDLINIF